MYRILIADDEGIMLESIKNIISKSFPGEFEISTAKTGRAAIEQAEFSHPDVVFMDIHMPGINGIQAMQEIRQRYGPNAVLKGMNLKDGATTIERNGQIGGHKAE